MIKIATTVYTQKEIELQDGTEVVLRPLPIARLRRFMAAWAKFNDVKDEEDGFNVFINCAGIALENNYKGKFDSLKSSEKGEFLSAEYKEHLEETLDLDTIYEILEVCGGLNFDALKDPKVQEALTQAVEGQEEAGKN